MLYQFSRLSRISSRVARPAAWINSNRIHLSILPPQQRFFSGSNSIIEASEDDDEMIEENLDKQDNNNINTLFVNLAAQGKYLSMSTIVGLRKGEITNASFNNAFVSAAKAHQLPTAMYVLQEAPHAITLDSIKEVIKTVKFIKTILQKNHSDSPDLNYATQALSFLSNEAEKRTPNNLTPAYNKEVAQIITFSSSTTPEAEPEAEPKSAKKARKAS